MEMDVLRPITQDMLPLVVDDHLELNANVVSNMEYFRKGTWGLFKAITRQGDAIVFLQHRYVVLPFEALSMYRSSQYRKQRLED